MARLTKNNSSLWGSNPPSPSDRNKQKFYEYYRAGLLDESKITNDGWKNLYEHELEKGYASASDIPRDAVSKYGIDTSVGRSNFSEPIDASLNTPDIDPMLETKEKESVFSKLSSFFGGIGKDNVPKYKQDFDTNTLPKPSTNLGDLLPKKPTVDTEFNSSAWNSVIEQKNQGLGLKPNFGNKSLVENDDPLLMALNSKIDPKFIGEHTKQVMNTINTNRFNKQMQEQAQLDQFGARNPYLPDGSINPNGSIAIPQDRPRVDSANQPFLSDGTLNPAGSIFESGAGDNNLKAGLHGAYREFIGRNAQLNTDKIIGQTSSALDRGVNQDMAQKVSNQRTEDREYWTEDRMFNAFLGKPHDAEITTSESVSRNIGGFAGNLGKMLLFSQVLGPATTTKGMIAKNAGLGALSRAESSYSMGEDSETIVKDALIGAGSFAIGELAGIGVTNKLTNQLIHTFKTQPQWANHLTALVRSARGITDGTVGTLSEIALSNVMGKETEMGLKDAVQSGLIMGIVNGVTSYIPWGRLNVSEQEMKSFNIKVDEVDGEFLKTNGYIKLSDIDGVNTNNPYINDIYINPNTKDIVVSATRDGAFLVPTSMVQDTLDSQTIDIINRIQDTPIRQDVDFKTQPDYIDKVSDPNKYAKILNQFMENEGYKLQSMDGQQVYAKYNQLNTVEGDWDIVPIAKAEQKFDNEYFTRHKNTQGPRVEAGPRTEQATIGRFDDSYEVNRAAMDTTGKQWVRDMQDKGYSEYKPGVWVKEVDGNIVDIVPEFTVGKGGKAIPVFDIKDGETNTSRIGVKGFAGGEYDIDKGATKPVNEYMGNSDQLTSAVKDAKDIDTKTYDDFMANMKELGITGENVKGVADADFVKANKRIEEFLNKKSVREIFATIRNINMEDDADSTEKVHEFMGKFNNEYNQFFFQEGIASEAPKVKSATRPIEETKVDDVVNTEDSTNIQDEIETTVNNGDIVNYDGHNYVVDKVDGDKIEIIGADPNYSEKLTVNANEVNAGKLIKEYKEGDKVQFTSPDGEILSGTIRYIDEDEGEATIKVDQSVITPDGVPIGRVEYVKLEDIQNVDLNEAPQSSTNDLNSESEEMVEGGSETLLEGQGATTKAGNIQVGNTIDYQSGDKVNSGVIVRIDEDRIFIKNNIDDFVTKDIHKDSIVGIRSGEVTESPTMDLEEEDNQTLGDNIKSDTASPQEVEEVLKDYTDAEKYSIGEFAQKMTTDREKDLDRKLTDDEITKQFDISVSVAKQLVDAINNKDFDMLTGRLNRQNSNSLKLFSDLTGLSTRTQKVTVESIRSLDPESYDNWKISKADEAKTQKDLEKQEEKEAKEKEKQEELEEISKNKVRTTKGLTTIGELVESSFTEGYRLVKTNDYGGYEWTNPTTDDNLNYKGLSKDNKRYVREKYEEFEEKAIADDEAREQTEYDAMNDEEKSKYDADIAHLFGEDKVPGKNAEDISEDIKINSKGEYNIVRIGNEDANLKPSTIPQGLYVSIPDDVDNFNSPHDSGNIKYIGTAKPKNTLVVEDTKIEHARFGASKEGYGSAGIVALKALVGDDEFNRLLKLNKREMTELLNEKYPGNDYGRYYDSYELLEAYAGLLARDKNYDSILLEDKAYPELSELVILKDNVMEIMKAKFVNEAVASNEPKEQSESVTKASNVEFSIGDRVSFQKKDKTLTGTIRSIDYDNMKAFLNLDKNDDGLNMIGNIDVSKLSHADKSKDDKSTKKERINIDNVLSEIFKNNEYRYYAIRGTDEPYNIGDVMNTSYDWDFENDSSTYYSDNPVALGGVSGTNLGTDEYVDMFEETNHSVDFMLQRVRYWMKNYSYKYFSIIGSNERNPLNRYENDLHEIILGNAKVLATGEKEQIDIDLKESPVKNAEKEVVEQNEGINKTKINTQDYFLKDVIENIREDLSNIIDADTVDEIIDNFDGSGLGYISNLDTNEIQQEFILGALKNELMDVDLAKKVYNMILGEVKSLNGGASDDNRANDTKTDNRKQPKGNESDNLQGIEAEQGTGRVPGLEGRTDDTKDRSGEGRIKTDDSGVRGTTTERSGESSNERNVIEVGNFRITDEITLHEGGKKTRYKNNVNAIKLVKQLDTEGRKATLEEQKILAKYVGWGGITEAFYDDEPKWVNEYKELKELLTEEEYRQARESRLNAHYTAREVIDKMYQAVKKLGFKNGKILEPAVGSGNFFGLLPEEFFNSQLHAVELEPITGKIATHLYPDAKVNIMGYENYKVPNNYFDLIISNVPFGNFNVNDKDYNHLKFSIHNYYFAKSLDKVKEGGIIAFVTSSFTMDSKDKSVREHINSKAKLLGAIRLPNNAFSENAGTEVTTDIIFLRKLKQGETSNNKWLSMGEIDGVPVNEYYVDNPDMLLGTMTFSQNMYGKDSTTLVADVDDISDIFNSAINNLPENVFDVSTNFVEVEKVTTIGDFQLGKYDKVGSIVFRDDKAYQVLDDRLEPITQNKTIEKNGVKTKVEVPLEGKRIGRIKGMIQVKEALRETIDAQLKDLPNTEINKAIKNLNEVYDTFVKANGYVNDNANKLAFRTDADYQRIASLEKWDAKTKKYAKSDVFFKRTIEVSKRVVKADNAIDGLGVVLNEDGYVDVDRIADLTSKATEEVIEDLRGLIYKNPKTKTYQTKDEYLSGNVKDKLRIAKAYAKEEPEYTENVEALEAVIPEDVPAKDIDTKFGQPWIDDTIIQDFTNALLEDDSQSIKVKYIPTTGDWVVEGKTVNRAIATNKFGTPRMSAEDIIENLLNSREVRVNVYVGSGDDRKIDKKTSRVETAKALEKSKLIIKEFKDYIFADQDRRNYLVDKYNELFNNTVLRSYDGSFLTFNGMSENIRGKFRGYQKSAVARIVFSGNTLLAHTVGAGKTFEMIAGAMELKRLGLANKPMFVVPNHLIGQWENSFYQLYPNANILAATKNDFTKENRKRLFSMISNNNYDAVIVAHSSFGRIPVSKETEIEFINMEINDVEQAIIASKEADGKGSRVTKQLEKTLKTLRTNLEVMNDKPQDNVVTFEELGVDYLFVDEAHNFKNLFFYTKMSRIAGVQNSKAKRATDMYMKTRLVSRLHNNKRGIVFATGTPVSNSIAEMFTMQRYLQLETLQEIGVSHFDTWANMFGDTVTKPEVDKTGKGFKMKTRFTDYVNVPELKKLFRSFADIINQDDLKRFLQEEGLGVNALPEMDGGKPITVQAEPSEQLVDYIEELVARSEAVELGKVEPTEDNALKITNDGRVSALDMRLIDGSYDDDPNSKLNLAIANVFKEYQDGNKDKTTQLVFSDLGTPKKQKTKEQKLKTRKVVRANGYETYQWYYDKENEKKYVVVKIDKENEEIYKLFEDGDEAMDSLEDNNTDRKTIAPYNFDVDIDDYIDSLGGDETDFEVKFDIYNDIREKLVSMGVPRNEIAFIHEANTDVAKEKMFDKVRKGEIRILLGSTAKMGEGMNVQDRLIALHHLDAPWKPSAIEQRNGRIIRFGNMHKTIRVYQYVTKGSFDAYIWSMLERKATFISKIMDSDFSTRKYTDAFDPVVLNASEVKALASNDPRILEKFEVDKDVEELQNLKHSHRAEQYDIQDKISKNQRTLDKSDSLLADLKTDIKSVVNLKGDNFKVVIGGKTYEARKEAGQALMEALEKLDNFVEEEVGTFGGFKLSLYRTGAENKGILRGKGKYEIQLSTSPSGNITRLENLLNEPERRLNEANRLIERAKKEIVTYKEQLGKPFAREDELEKILKRQAELDNELSLDRPEESTEVEEAEVINNASSNTSSTRSSIPNNATRDIPNGERKRTKKIKPISEIIKDIEQDFETSVSSKRYRGGRGAIGQYQTHSESIRVKTDNNIQTIAHELGHHFDKKYNLSTKYSSFINIMEDGLSLSDDYKPEEIPGEVIAEFIRLYLVTDNQAYELSPDFYNAFMETLDNKDLKNLNKHKEDILNWYASDLMERGQSTIRSHTERKKSSTKDKLTNLEMFVFDDLAPIRMFSETVEEYTGQKLNFRQHPYVLAMQSRRAGMMAKSQIIYAQTDAEGNVIGESFKELLKDIPKEKMKAFDDYLKVSHAITLNEYGKQVYSDDFTIEDMQLMKVSYELDNPQFADIAQGVYEWWSRFVEEWVVKQGFLAPEVWADLKEKYPTYVPNFRYIGEENYGSQARRGFGNQNSPIKRMKGSAKDTYSVIESLLIYTDKIVKTQKRNEVGLAVHDLYLQVEGLGDTLTKITHESQLNKYNAQDLKISLTTQLITDYIDQLTGADKDKANKLADNGEYEELMEFLTSKGFAGAEIVDNTIDDIITFFTPRMFSTDRGVYTVIDKAGKTHFYEVHDPLFLEAMLNLSDKSMDKVTRLIGAWKRMFTNLTTGANPIFGVTSNIWGDVPQAFIYGNYKNPLEFGVDLAKSMKDIFTGNEKAEAYYAMGGGMSSPISENRQLMTEMLNKLFPDMKKSGVKSMVDYMIGQIEQFNDTIESAPRLTEFTKVMEEHGDSYEGRLRAIYEASELTTNFLRHGRMQYTIIGQGVPFLNAGLQGMYKLHQEYINRRGAGRNDLTGDGGRKKDNKRLAGIMLKALLSITIFEILQMIAYQDDEEYNKLAEYLKDGYWLIKYDDGKFIRIKKPRAEGMIFGSMFRRGFKQGIGDKAAWEGFADTFVNTFLPPNPATDNIFAAVIGVGRNKTWSGNPIVPVRLQNLPPLEQYDISTSSISKAVSQVLNKATGIETSPKNIDYLIQQYTGIIGQVLLPATTETTTVGGAIARKMTTDLAFSNSVVNEFYDNKEKLDAAYTLYNQKGTKSKDFDPVQRYRYNQISSDMSDLWKEINSIKEDTVLSLEEKQTKERALRLELMKLADPENLKPTSYDEFKVLYNRGQDMTSKYKEQYENTKVRPEYTKEEQILLQLYNVKVDGQRSQLGAVNYQLTQINKRRKQVEGTNTLTEANKKKALQKLDDSQKQIVDKYMEFYRTKYNIDIDKYF